MFHLKQIFILLSYPFYVAMAGLAYRTYHGRLCSSMASIWNDWQGILVGKPQGNRPPRIPKRRREDNIRVDLRERGGEV